MHLRFVTRLHVVAALVTVSLLAYSLWIYPSLHVKTRLTKAWAGSERRIIVFGDSFSDTGKNVVELPLQESGRKKESAEGPRWTEILCQEFVCDEVLNFARSAPNSTMYSGGSVVNNDIYTNTTSHNEISPLSLLPDLKDQVLEWLDYDDAKDSDNNDEIIFTISFGFWDMWQYATLDLGTAQDAISDSIFELFKQLDVIADRFDDLPRIVLPNLWDVTFTPRFMSLSQGQYAREFAEQQHKAVYLTEYWNVVLMQAAANWRPGRLYVPDWNTWLLEEIRSTQLQKVGLFNDLRIGAHVPDFMDVSQPCVESVVVSAAKAGSSARNVPVLRCQYPKQHLFWDDTQFSSTAHRLLGKAAARLVNSNETANAHVMGKLQDSASIVTDGNESLRITLTPSLAPGN